MGLWTPKGDIFALGVMFYRMFCFQQRAPFGGNTMEQIQADTIRFLCAV